MNETTTQPDLLIGTITKDSKREIRVEVRTYEGHRVIDIWKLWPCGLERERFAGAASCCGRLSPQLGRIERVPGAVRFPENRLRQKLAYPNAKRTRLFASLTCQKMNLKQR